VTFPLNDANHWKAKYLHADHFRMAIFRAQLLKGLLGRRVKAANGIKRELFIFTHIFKHIILAIPLKFYSNCSYRVLYRNYATSFCCERISSYKDWFSRYIMAPKRKQPAATKVMRWLKEKKGVRNAASNCYDLVCNYL
jgi:hypothetical protein